MAELMIRGGGRCPAERTDALATQAAWVAHRRRKVATRPTMANQVIGQLDLVFCGLDGCFSDVLGAKAGRVIVTELCDPDRVQRQGVTGLQRFVACRGVRLATPRPQKSSKRPGSPCGCRPPKEQYWGGFWPPTWCCWPRSKLRSPPLRPPWRGPR